MTSYIKKISSLIILLLSAQCILLTPSVWGWSGRGHSSICEASVFLLKNPELKKFLQSRPHIMGHLCNIPDIEWKQLPVEISKIGNSTHFISLDALDIKLGDIPGDYKEFQKIVSTKNNQDPKNNQDTKDKQDPKNTSASKSDWETKRPEVGSVWWRVNQFFERVARRKADFSIAKKPMNPREQQDDKFLYNQLIFDTMVDMGLMGHFVGDISQPLHNTADYDGWFKGHGGLHAYYEEFTVAYFGSDLINLIAQKAANLKNPDFLKPESVVEKMRLMSAAAYKDLDMLYKLDPIKKPSTIKHVEDLEIKTPAEREAPVLGQKKYRELILTHTARAALMLAHLWDLAYEKAGRPDLENYKNYRYPLKVEFIPPDYF